jgi:hypothetical protein
MKRFLPSLRRLVGLGPKLRNKPGGMAWIKPFGHNYGADAMAGQAVRVVQIARGTTWLVEPAPTCRLTSSVIDGDDRLHRSGSLVEFNTLEDSQLEPWRDHDWSGEDESARYLPPVPQVAAPMVTKEAA